MVGREIPQLTVPDGGIRSPGKLSAEQTEVRERKVTTLHRNEDSLSDAEPAFAAVLVEDHHDLTFGHPSQTLEILHAALAVLPEVLEALDAQRVALVEPEKVGCRGSRAGPDRLRRHEMVEQEPEDDVRDGRQGYPVSASPASLVDAESLQRQKGESRLYISRRSLPVPRQTRSASPLRSASGS